MKVIGYWFGKNKDILMWAIGKYRISDKNFKHWIYNNFDYPFCYADIIRQCHIDKYLRSKG